MRFLSMFSGIEAASVAWEPLGWRAVALCENDSFASAVLEHHYPNVPNLGDVEKADFDAIGPIDLAVFGSPCQSFSVAGKRLGLDDPRGNLALIGGQVVYRKRPRWFVFENVPGLLSSDAGWDFGTLLASFAGYPAGSVFEPPAGGWKNSGVVRQAEGGYGLAYRVLDAQYVRVDGFGRAVPQRRRRVFVVGYLGDWRRAAAVLFERQGMSWDSAPRRQPGQRTAPTLAARTRGGGGLGTDFDCDGGLIPDVSKSPAASRGSGCANAEDLETYLPVAFGGNNQSGPIDVATAQTAHGGAGRMDFESETFVAHALRADGFDASEDGTGRGTPLVPVVAGPLTACGGTERKHGQGWGQQEWESGYAIPVAQGVALRGRDEGATAELTGDVMTSLRTGGGGGDKPHVLVPTFALQAGSTRENPSSGPDGVGVQEGCAYTIEARAEVQAVAFAENTRNELRLVDGDGGIAPSLQTQGGKAGRGYPAIAFNARQDPDVFDVHTGPLDTDGSTQGIFSAWRVRRLMPVECERLQGFPDGYTAIRYRGKPAADGPRYKALGNSFAVNVVRWIGRRIAAVEALEVVK